MYSKYKKSDKNFDTEKLLDFMQENQENKVESEDEVE